jgi:hypothetical protein
MIRCFIRRIYLYPFRDDLLLQGWSFWYSPHIAQQQPAIDPYNLGMGTYRQWRSSGTIFRDADVSNYPSWTHPPPLHPPTSTNQILMHPTFLIIFFWRLILIKAPVGQDRASTKSRIDRLTSNMCPLWTDRSCLGHRCVFFPDGSWHERQHPLTIF